MAKERKVVYTLALEADSGNASAANAAVAHFQAVTKAANEARAAMTQAYSASSRVQGARNMAGASGSTVNASATGPARAARNSERAINRELDMELRERAKLFEREKKMMADRVRANLAASKAVRDAAREAEGANIRKRLGIGGGSAGGGPSGPGGGPSDADMKRHVENLGRQYAQAESLERQRQAAASKAWKDTGQAITAATHATISYGRAMVLLAAADEESARRALQKLAKFEAFASVLTGTIQLVKAGTSAWRAYQAAALAAAAASSAASASRSVSSGVAGGLAGRAAGSAVGGVVGGAGVGLLGNVGGGAAIAGAAVAAKGALIVAAGSLLFGAMYFGMAAVKAKIEGKSAKEGMKKAGSDLLEGLGELTGFSDRAGDAAKAWKQRWENVAKDIKEREAVLQQEAASRRELRSNDRDIAVNRAGLGMSDAQLNKDALISGKGEGVTNTYSRSLAEAQARQREAFANLEADRRRLALAATRTDIHGPAEKRDAMGAMKESIGEFIEARRGVLDIERQIKQTQIDGARESLRGLHERRNELQKLLEDEANARRSAAARFGAMDPGKQQQLLAINQKFMEGKPFTRNDEDAIAELGGGAAEAADASRAKRAYASGFGEFEGPKGLFASKAAGPLAMVNSQITNSVTVTIEKQKVELDKLVDEFKKTIGPLLELNRKQTLDDYNEAMRQWATQQQLRDAQGGGG